MGAGQAGKEAGTGGTGGGCAAVRHQVEPKRPRRRGAARAELGAAGAGREGEGWGGAVVGKIW